MGLGEHDSIVAAARQAEALGDEELWSYDHLGAVDPFDHDGEHHRLHVADLGIRPAQAHVPIPFVLVGSVGQVVDELERRRIDLGVSHVVVRDAEGFAPVVAALAGR